MEALIAPYCRQRIDVNYIVDAVNLAHAQAVIPPHSHRKVLREYDIELYKERNLIEKMFNKLKHFRSITTRYDRLAITFLAFLDITAIFIWLK
ncbi:hypothetical protein MIDIC_70017 [Alphaproteobacteria bacterium]